jgi:hypothetical protein
MKHFKIGALLLTALLALTACEDEQQVASYDFTATVEQMASENNNTKVYLLNEEWIYWEMGDMISIGNLNALYYCFPKTAGDVVAKTRLAAEELFKMQRREKRKIRNDGGML